MLIDGFPAVSLAADQFEIGKDLSGLIVRDSSGKARQGVFYRGTLNLLTARTDMAVDVQDFDGVAERRGGVIFNKNEGVTQSPTLNRPAANSHIALIYWKQRVAAAPWSDGADGPIFGVVYGDPAPIPQKPALTIEGAVELGTVLIPSTATSTSSTGVVITTTAQFTASAGAPVAFRTRAEMLLWTTATAGQQANVVADPTSAYNRVWYATGSGWVHSTNPAEPFAFAAGAGANAAGAYATVNLPVGRFTQPPLVYGKTRGALPAIFHTSTITATTSQVAGFVGTSAVAAQWDWYAIQMTPDSAAG